MRGGAPSGLGAKELTLLLSLNLPLLLYVAVATAAIVLWRPRPESEEDDEEDNDLPSPGDEAASSGGQVIPEAPLETKRPSLRELVAELGAEERLQAIWEDLAAMAVGAAELRGNEGNQEVKGEMRAADPSRGPESSPGTTDDDNILALARRAAALAAELAHREPDR